MGGASLVYMQYYDQNGKHLDHGKILDQIPHVGYIVKRYTKEGYIPWEITALLLDDEKAFGGHSLYRATIKQLPFVKTHCDHTWNNSRSLQICPKFLRECTKCHLKEEFNYGSAKWIPVT